MAPFLKVEGLTKKFGGLTAVNTVSFQMKRDEIVGLIGPNGSGKTTLIRLITGALKSDAGTVTFRGEDITGQSSWGTVKKGIVATHQVVRPFRGLPIIANVMIGCIGAGRVKRGEWVKRIEAKAQDALEFCGIAHLAKERASILSHGDLTRLEIARALATEPELLMLDEPFGGLNPHETELMAKSIKRLHKGGRFGRLHSEGPSMLIIEHKLADLMKIVDRMIVLNYGEILAIGTPHEIANDEKVIVAYIGGEM
ncbi:MAG: ABC transporter ATP-binding protein [Desulfobacterales bacterium]|nr:ABC transporter ATP-binding protein [Desulfobacterales bacterium]